jgi:small GTP-binding protein
LHALKTEIAPSPALGVVRKKVCLLGDFAVGKTSLIRRYVFGAFEDNYLTTIGVTLAQKSLTRVDHELRLIVWDLAGGEDFSRSETRYLRGAAGALIICDLTRAASLPSLNYYANQLWDESPGAAVLLVGNKCDLATNHHHHHHRQAHISQSELHATAADLNLNYLLTSAKTGENVDLAFRLLADLIEPKTSCRAGC